MRLAPWTLTVPFAVLFALIANLAWLTAIATTAPWFGTSVSLETYGLSAAVASVLAVALVLGASNRASRLDLRMLWLDGQIARLRAAPGAGNSPRGAPDPAEELDLGPDMDEELAEVRIDGVASVLGMEKQGHDTLFEVPGLQAPAGSRGHMDVLRELVRARVALREARATLWRTVAGPAFVATLFVTMSAVMIPGAEGFAASHFQLNTTLVLFLGYGIGPLVAWTVLALATLGGGARRPVA